MIRDLRKTQFIPYLLPAEPASWTMLVKMTRRPMAIHDVPGGIPDELWQVKIATSLYWRQAAFHPPFLICTSSESLLDHHFIHEVCIQMLSRRLESKTFEKSQIYIG